MCSEFAGAYTDEAACLSYTRKLRLTDSRSRSVLVIEDVYELSERKASDEIQFVTPGKVKVMEGGVLTIENEGEVLKMSYPTTLVPDVEEMKIEDNQLTRHWGNALYAIRFKSAPDAPVKGTYVFTCQMR